MITRICKSFTFDAAHRLDRLPPEHKCHRMHGHTYRVRMEISCYRLGDLGMALDYDQIDHVWRPVHDAIDHRVLNEVEGLEVPTTERLSRWIFDRLLLGFGTQSDFALIAVRVYESRDTWAEVRR